MSRRRRFVLSALGALAVVAARAQPGPVTPPAPVINGPVVQMLVPGFTVRELPVQLRNLNNLVYAPDGRLFALGYDGNVHLLKDTDGDGLEDTATKFWDNAKNEIPPSIGMASGANGLYIASRGKIIYLKDKGDGTADLEIVASGWRPSIVAAGSNLDAIGLAVDPAGNIYYGLGVDAYNGAYRVNRQTGQADYNQFHERGAVIKLSPDGKRREIIATGVRFTVGMAFNAAGDLFATDQEGATWLPNGNPFDELLHIQPGRHYGFPPRHPLYLPGVIDEPSVFDYGPQHQSTCGLHFNEPVGGGTAIFGPDWWRGDAIVAGESRGKLWRTKLVKTAAGYVAKNDLIASLGMLTIDATPTPSGDLLVCLHSGAPDWGTGPRGMGKLFKISLTDKKAAQPVLAYAASPSETRVIFDRPIEPSQWRALARASGVTMGAYSAAADRLERFVPGYQAVKDQGQRKKTELRVLSAGIAPDLRSVVLQTTPRVEATNYAVKLGGETTIDLLTDLTGVEAEWRDAAGKVAWTGWLPHLDLKAARELTAASEEHGRLFALLRTPGTLRLSTQLDLHLMLRTAIQPGAKLDFTYPAETVTIALKGSGRIELQTAAVAQRDGENAVRITTGSSENAWSPVDVTLATGGAEPTLEVAWHTAEDARARALPLRRMLVPWAKPTAFATEPVAERRVPEIQGGDWQRGRQVFASAAAACAVCHQVRGTGGIIGPDLSNLVYRDYASVLKDIVQPSAAINPDRIAYVVELRDGGSVGGMILEDTAEKIVIADVSGAQRTIPRTNVTGMKASAVSLMPEGLWQNLTPQQRKDLMTFLLTEPPVSR